LPEGTIAGRALFVYEEHGACSLPARLGPTAPAALGSPATASFAIAH
jgi:hypothetical protein